MKRTLYLLLAVTFLSTFAGGCCQRGNRPFACGVFGRWGCGQTYRGDWAEHPPECCEPCDSEGNFDECASCGGRRWTPVRTVAGTVLHPAVHVVRGTWNFIFPNRYPHHGGGHHGGGHWHRGSYLHDGEEYEGMIIDEEWHDGIIEEASEEAAEETSEKAPPEVEKPAPKPTPEKKANSAQKKPVKRVVKSVSPQGRSQPKTKSPTRTGSTTISR